MPRPRPRDLTPGPFGTNLNYYRERAGLTIAQLAAATGINHADISRWETGSRPHKRGPHTATLHKLAAALGCTEAQLIAPPRATGPAAQIDWGRDYITRTYGPANPCPPGPP
jgi:transcriptional regulator with XRE-family HTH domain